MEKKLGQSLSIGVRIIMIRCVVYLLRIFKMFQGIMNNPVYKNVYLAIYPKFVRWMAVNWYSVILNKVG
jgi:hypothetical protein